MPLDGSSDPVTVPLGGDYVLDPPVEEPPPGGGGHPGGPGPHLNGIEATADGSALIGVQSSTGLLYSIDPATGMAEQIDLGGYLLTGGDGLLLRGRTLYVVRNLAERLVTVELSPDLSTGTVVLPEATHARFDVPTTVDSFGSGLYVVSARLTTAPLPDTAYWITRIESAGPRAARIRSGGLSGGLTFRPNAHTSAFGTP